MSAKDVPPAIVDYFGAHAHNAWLKDFRKTHPAERKQPRMRMRGGVLVDINRPWKQLDAQAKGEDKVAAAAAYEALRRHPNNREAAAAYVHECWIKRNKLDPNQPKALFAPYQKLSEAEKEKDRQHIDVMKEALMAVKKKAAKTAPKKTAAKRASKRPSAAKKNGKAAGAAKIDAATVQKLEAIAAELSALTGRRVTAGQAALAGAQAILSFYKVGLG